MRAGRQADQLFRYHALKVMSDIGFFEHLQQPSTYGQILTEHGFVDSGYTREFLTTLVNDRRNVIRKDGALYQVNPAHPLPKLSDVVSRTDSRIRGFVLLAEGMSRYILPRLRAEPLSLAESFEMDGRQLLTKFDRVLAIRTYSAMRNAAFAYLHPKDRKWLDGKSLLDIGCGSGRETAEIWLKLKGDVQITAIDPVESMLELARRHFSILLDELDPTHPPLTEANTPAFENASATRLPYDDNSFDAGFLLFILHWTPDPQKAINEVVRVVRPGGLIFGAQAFKPEANPYFDLVIRSNKNCHGFFWREDYRNWFASHGLVTHLATPAGIFRVRNDPRAPLDVSSSVQEFR